MRLGKFKTTPREREMVMAEKLASRMTHRCAKCRRQKTGTFAETREWWESHKEECRERE